LLACAAKFGYIFVDLIAISNVNTSKANLVSQEEIMFRCWASFLFFAAVFHGNLAFAQSGSVVDGISAIAASSPCRSTLGGPPRAYIRGVSIVFAKAVCESDRDDVKVVASAARMDAPKLDGLAWYQPQFAALGLVNDRAGVETMRHAFALLLGLGIRESSGRYCVGRDSTADFTSADSAEAGLFQTSWGVHVASPVLEPMFRRYDSDRRNCLLDIFKDGVRCSRWDARTWGEGTGADWQKLTKACPAFATEYAAVVLRTSGGSRGEFGPIRRREAQLTSACDTMLSKVQDHVASHPEVCAALR
jgi:hypothetical protein